MLSVTPIKGHRSLIMNSPGEMELSLRLEQPGVKLEYLRLEDCTYEVSWRLGGQKLRSEHVRV